MVSSHMTLVHGSLPPLEQRLSSPGKEDHQRLNQFCCQYSLIFSWEIEAQIEVTKRPFKPLDRVFHYFEIIIMYAIYQYKHLQ
jgi:hypothetical protein